jgi:hypothetical protein
MGAASLYIEHESRDFLVLLAAEFHEVQMQVTGGSGELCTLKRGKGEK